MVPLASAAAKRGSSSLAISLDPPLDLGPPVEHTKRRGAKKITWTTGGREQLVGKTSGNRSFSGLPSFDATMLYLELNLDSYASRALNSYLSMREMTPDAKPARKQQTISRRRGAVQHTWIVDTCE